MTVFLLSEVIPIGAWMLSIDALQALAWWVIRQLPRSVKRAARHEIGVVLTVAKWSGVACYTVLTAKDLVHELGAILVF